MNLNMRSICLGVEILQVYYMLNLHESINQPKLILLPLELSSVIKTILRLTAEGVDKLDTFCITGIKYIAILL